MIAIAMSEAIFANSPSISFPVSLASESAIKRLAGALMLQQNDAWTVTRQYMTLEIVTAFCENDSLKPAKIATL